MRQGISAVAFDLDGTLYPGYSLNIRLLPFLCKHWPLLSAFAIARSVIRRRQEQSPSSVLPDFYHYQAQIAARLLHAPAERVREKIDRLIYRGWEPHFSKIKPFPHVRELLLELRAAGLKLGLLSDFPPNTKLENMGLAGCWDAVLCSENIGAIKPAIRPFTELSLALGYPPEQILYVGNSRRYDAAGAGRIGMKTALFTGGFACNKSGADFFFRNYRQLREYMLQ